MTVPNFMSKAFSYHDLRGQGSGWGLGESWDSEKNTPIHIGLKISLFFTVSIVFSVYTQNVTTQ